MLSLATGSARPSTLIIIAVLILCRLPDPRLAYSLFAREMGRDEIGIRRVISKVPTPGIHSAGGASVQAPVVWLGISYPQLGCFLLFWALQVCLSAVNAPLPLCT